jgi:hypothetical protein
MFTRKDEIYENHLTGVCTIALAFGGASMAVAQDKSTAAQSSKETQQDTKTTTGNKTMKTSSDVVRGKVESYEPGKSIKVTVPGKISSTKSFDLNSKDETVNVASNLKVGDWVSVREKTANNGHKTLTVSHYKHATKTKKASS